MYLLNCQNLIKIIFESWIKIKELANFFKLINNALFETIIVVY